MQEVIPTVASPSDDDLFDSLISPEAVQLAATFMRIARLVIAREHDVDMDPGQ
jgi:hypothetical protein